MMTIDQQILLNELDSLVKRYQHLNLDGEITVSQMLMSAIIGSQVERLSEIVCAYGEERLEELNAKVEKRILTAKAN